MNQVVLEVTDPSQVAEVRRKAGAMAAALGFTEVSAGNLALALTEAATNIIKHGSSGRILIRALATAMVNGLEVVAIDRGAGIADIPQSMRDGFSTVGSPGTGLGAISRLASNLEMYSQPGKGTALRFEVWDGKPERTLPAVTAGAVQLAKRGEQVCGDAWALREADGAYTVMVADGLGHGPDAAAAARAATRLLDDYAAASAAELLARAHDTLKSTRGAAAAVAKLDPARASGWFCGVGNISGVIHCAGAVRHLVSHNGTLGLNARKIQQFDFAFPKEAVLIMHSDGIGTHWSLDAYPGLARKHPALIAVVLHRDFERSRDDSTMVVACHATF